MKPLVAAALSLAVLSARPAAQQVPTDTPDCASPSTPALKLWCEGAVLWRAENFSGAIKPFSKLYDMEKKERTLSQSPWRVMIDNLGIGYGMSGDLKKAKSVFEYGISQDPDYPMFYYNLACTYAEMKDEATALKYLQEAFARKANIIVGETMPDPLKDDSFARFLGDPNFVAEVKKLTAAQ
jgi:tetratricopeptide (TPR) repeat protein